MKMKWELQTWLGTLYTFTLVGDESTELKVFARDLEEGKRKLIKIVGNAHEVEIDVGAWDY
ncbi:MAG: hypothetical protein ACQEXQ_21970 [Bacillota bacterium]